VLRLRTPHSRASRHHRAVRDLPCFAYRTTVIIELYRVRCPDCGLKIEKVDSVAQQSALQQTFRKGCRRSLRERFGAARSPAVRITVRAIDLRYLERWNAQRKKPALRQMGVDETLDAFFQGELSAGPRRRIESACVDMWEPFRMSIEQWSPDCAIVYDKFHILQHANKAVDEVRRAEFFRKGGQWRGVVKGKCWLLLTRWVNLTPAKRQELNGLFQLNRRVMKAYLLKESLDRLWTYTDEGAMVRYLKSWIRQLRWQRLPAFEKFAYLLLDHLDGILNYCRVKVRFGVVEAINGNIKTLLRRGRGYKNLRYLLLKAQRMAATKTRFIAFQKAA
jgi:transposase